MHRSRCIVGVLACVLVVFVTGMANTQSTLTPKEQLGKLVFFDTNLSVPAGQSCGSCHFPGTGYADPNHDQPVSWGAAQWLCGSRNTPTVSYCGFTPAFHFDAARGEYVGGQFRDGRAANLIEQAGMPLLNPLEMNNPSEDYVVQTVRDADYADQFVAVYGRDALKNVGTAFHYITDAIVAYERSIEISPFDSKYDHYLDRRATFGPQEALGKAIFEGKGGCSTCHPSAVGPAGEAPLFTNHTYVNIGVPKNPANPFYHMPPWYNEAGMDYVDVGLGGVAGLESQVGKIKVPTLRNVARTAPYGHNGYFATLREAVAFSANRGAIPMGRKDPGRPRMDTSAIGPQPEVLDNLDVNRVGNAKLTDAEIDAVVVFLETLTDGYVPHGMRDPGRPRQEESEDVPSAVRISPNPFNPVTRIEFTVTDGSTVRLAVYDVAGRLVRSLVDSAVPAGVHAATWDGTDARGARVASGIYFVRLCTNERTVIRKAVLTR